MTSEKTTYLTKDGLRLQAVLSSLFIYLIYSYELLHPTPKPEPALIVTETSETHVFQSDEMSQILPSGLKYSWEFSHTPEQEMSAKSYAALKLTVESPKSSTTCKIPAAYSRLHEQKAYLPAFLKSTSSADPKLTCNLQLRQAAFRNGRLFVMMRISSELKQWSQEKQVEFSVKVPSQNDDLRTFQPDFQILNSHS